MNSKVNGPNRSISIIVCCYNSELRIEQTIRCLSQLILPNSTDVELIVVDNASTDNTSIIVQELWESFDSPFPMRLLFEEKPGLSNARKKGTESAKGDFLLFCDDDNLLRAEYLEIGLEILNKNESVAILGGIGTELIESDKPEWFDRVRVMYAVGDQHKDYPDLTHSKQYVYGAGAFMRKRILTEIFESNIKQVFTDRTGNKLISGGDNELGYLIVASGYQIQWSRELTFKHFIPNERLNYDYLKRMRLGYAYSLPLINMYRAALEGKEYTFKINSWFSDIVISLKRFIRISIRLRRSKKRNLTLLLEYWFYLGRIKALISSFEFYRNANRQIKKNISILRS
ncbi:glycosyltransferase [Aureitalea marina]|uniref:Glycosyltransferase 2-like domain-containing protein n=1 Tax=Aureitalea marina TaxID=930804 RepID=A0A2S7KML6_9FLAO|nr:glycosyltransferase [Aureitalea marina]PQB03875.1 hypothetical protein BST85_02360 [Aureitalea marina]